MLDLSPVIKSQKSFECSKQNCLCASVQIIWYQDECKNCMPNKLNWLHFIIQIQNTTCFENFKQKCKNNHYSIVFMQINNNELRSKSLKFGILVTVTYRAALVHKNVVQ